MGVSHLTGLLDSDQPGSLFIAWRRETKLGEAGRLSESAIYVGAGALTVASFLFVAFVPLPRAYYPEIVSHRPQDFAPGVFFLLAFIGNFQKRDWERDPFEHFLVLSLIVGLLSLNWKMLAGWRRWRSSSLANRWRMS